MRDTAIFLLFGLAPFLSLASLTLVLACLFRLGRIISRLERDERYRQFQLLKAESTDDLIQASWYIGFAYALETYGSEANDN